MMSFTRLASEKELVEARIGVARRIRALRKARQWTQQELAYQSGIHMRHIQRLENISRPPAIEIDTIVKLAKTFNISYSELLAVDLLTSPHAL